MFDVDLTLEPVAPLTFEDHHDSVLGLRLAPAFNSMNGGVLTNTRGQTGADQVRGQRSEWVDSTAEIEGERVGVAIFDSPNNLHFPTRWHTRTGELIVASPFAQHNYNPELESWAYSMTPNQKLHFRYRVLIHKNDVDVAGFYRRFRERESAPGETRSR